MTLGGSSEAVYNITLIGDPNTGKTMICNAFARKPFQDNYYPTIGAAMTNIKYYSDETKQLVSMRIWDTAGGERYKSLAPVFYHDSHMALIVYDITDIPTFNNVQTWYETYNSNVTNNNNNAQNPIIIIGNKIDLKEDEFQEENIVSQEKGMNCAKKLNCCFIEVSGKTGENIDLLFNMIQENLSKNSAITERLPTTTESSCC